LKHSYHTSIILIPVYNDWEALSCTIKEIRKTFESNNLRIPYLVIVNDGSTINAAAEYLGSAEKESTVLHLHRNLGHQKAIATGLSYINDHYSFDKLIVMDADGEDVPQHIPGLLKCSDSFPEKIILAKRIHRKEGLFFQLLYRFYKFFFYILTGRQIAFGNFGVLSQEHTRQLVHYSEIWNSLAGGILKSGIPYASVPTPKGTRYEGTSKMNLTSLIVHGLNTISVFIEIISVRILILSFVIIIFSILCILAITCIKIFTPYAISGWASILASSMLVIMLQSFLISLVMIMIFLSSQSQRKLIPAYHYTDYLQRSENIADEQIVL
jgi:hypothetical protein